MLQNMVEKWAAKKQAKELSQFIEALSGMDSDEIGMVVAGATDIRHKLFAKKGWDLLFPSVELARDPNIIMQLGSLVRELQRQKKLTSAAALMVWAHSVRARCHSNRHADVRSLGRNMWRQLARGFDHVEQAAKNSHDLLGVSFNIEGFRSFPDGLTPEPI